MKSLPEPERVLVDAEKAPPKVRIGTYWESVCVLREKDYSWREIAEWLNERGVPIHQKQLERYAKKRAALGEGADDEEEGSTS